MKGIKKGSGTRSGLLWEVERLIEELGDNLPQVILMENVPNVIGERNIKDFNDWCLFLEQKGYHNYIKVLNAKEVGFPEPIPQNRNRCFMVSILGEYSYTFPLKSKLRLKLKDMLEKEVSQKYFLSEKMINYIISEDDKYKVSENNLVINRSIACTKSTREGNTRADCSDYIVEIEKENINLKELLAIKNNTKIGYLFAQEGDGINLEQPNSKTRRGRVGKGVAQTLLTSCNQGVVVNKKNDLKIRKLTPKECWRLMGFNDMDFDKASKVNSNSQLYKEAGNSIVVNVLMAIFKEML